MIDDKQTCDVCGEEFNEERPHHNHTESGDHAQNQTSDAMDEDEAGEA